MSVTKPSVVKLFRVTNSLRPAHSLNPHFISSRVNNPSETISGRSKKIGVAHEEPLLYARGQ
jgi:hypothetical protein